VRRRLRFAAPVVALALAASCASSGSDEDAGGSATTVGGAATPTETCTAERVGGSIDIGTAGLPPGIDPIATTGSASTGGIELAQFYDTLMRYDPESGTYEPRVAESLEADAQSKVWTLTLRDGVTFGNGDPLTADTVKTSIERYQQLNRGPYKNLAVQIETMEVRDPKTVVFTLKQPWAGFAFTLANGPGMIVNPAVVAERGDTFATNPTGAGVGAYEFVRYAQGEELVYKAKADHWDGPVCIEELRFKPFVADPGRYEAFENGQYQAAYLRDPLIVSQSFDDGVAGLDTYQNSQTVLLLNGGASPSPVNDPKLRQAVAKAINVEQLNERVFAGSGDAETSIIGSGSRYADGQAGPGYDLPGATQLVGEVKAGGWNGNLSLTCAQSSEEVALTLQAQLNAAGMNINISLVPDFSALVDQVGVKKQFDLACWGLNGLDEGLWATYNSSLVSTSPSNYGGLKDPAIDAAMDELRIATDDDATKAALADLQKALTATVPTVPLFHGFNRVIHTPEVVGITPTGNSLVFFDSAFLEQ
jgi:peptide/nickel transport system substrate-binding protein